MRPGHEEGRELKAPAYGTLHARIMSALETLEAGAGTRDTRALRAAIEDWWRVQQDWNEQLAGLLAVHHEINNALVGIKGNAQLMLIGPAGQQAGIRERLEVVIRESKRIQEAVGRLRAVREAFGGSDATSRAA